MASVNKYAETSSIQHCRVESTNSPLLKVATRLADAISVCLWENIVRFQSNKVHAALQHCFILSINRIDWVAWHQTDELRF